MLVALLALPAVAHADRFVTSTADVNDGTCDDHCTLREAVALATGGETIDLAATTYTLTEGQLELEGNFTIDGEGARATTIRSDGDSRVGYVGDFSTITLTDLTVTNGRADATAAPNPGAGGAFVKSAAGGELRLFGVTLFNNEATARGGAIAAFGSLTVVESAVVGNRAGTSPGITGFGGGIYLPAPGGNALLINSTLSDNQAILGEGASFGGGMWAEDNFTMQHVTIADNDAAQGGGIFQDADTGAPNMTGVLLAENDGGNCAGSMDIVEEDHNLADDTSCEFGATGDLEVSDARIDELADNGGQTDTHGLLPDSLAIDARPLDCPQTDQRLVPRPQPGPCAFGAFEGSLGTDFTVTATHDNPGTTCSAAPTDCTLRDALLEAGPDDAVILAANQNPYVVAETPLPMEGDTIAGAGARTTTIEADGDDRVLNVTAGDNEVAGVTITGGSSPGAPMTGLGGGILVNGASTSLLMSNTTVTGNEASEGGGIATNGSTLTIIRSTISNNSAGRATDPSEGGGLALGGGTTTLTNTTVSGNESASGESPGVGGGISVNAATLTTRNVTIAFNRAFNRDNLEPGEGAAISRSVFSPGTVTLTNTIIGGSGTFSCDGPAFAGDHNVVDNATCGSPVKNPVLAALANNGGQTNTHAIGATSAAVDAAVNCDATDQRGQTRVRACDAGSYEYTGSLPSKPPSGPGPPPPPPDDGELPPPEPGKNVNALPKSGTVKIKLPGSSTYVTLDEGQQIPLGTTVDVLKGRVTIVAAGGNGQTADFYGGIFKLTQTKGSKPITVLTLVEKLTCAKKKANATAKKKRKRRLWGDGRGRFRTKGRHSAATVVGTKWLVQDTCTTTLTRVVNGRVRVRDFAKKKNVIVKAGKKYVARAR